MFADKKQDQTRKAGLEALAREHGTGDYTQERKELFAGETVDSIVEKIDKRRAIHSEADER